MIPNWIKKFLPQNKPPVVVQPTAVTILSLYERIQKQRQVLNKHYPLKARLVNKANFNYPTAGHMLLVLQEQARLLQQHSDITADVRFLHEFPTNMCLDDYLLFKSRVIMDNHEFIDKLEHILSVFIPAYKMCSNGMRLHIDRLLRPIVHDINTVLDALHTTR